MFVIVRVRERSSRRRGLPPGGFFYSSGLVGGAPADSWAASPPAARQADPEPRGPHLQANQVAPIQRAGGRRAPRSTGPASHRIAAAGPPPLPRDRRRGGHRVPVLELRTWEVRPTFCGCVSHLPTTARRAGLLSATPGQGPCDAVCWLQARLVQPLPPRAMRASFTCRHRKSHFGGGFAPRPKPLRSPQATFERERGAAGDRQMPARVPTAPLFAGRVGPPRFPFNSSPAG